MSGASILNLVQAITVTVIICNHNREQLVLECLQSVFQQSFKPGSVLVVDNASTDDSVASIGRKFPDRVEILPNAENLGSAGGFAVGMKEALAGSAHYVLLLDSDTLLREDALEHLVNHIQDYPECGVAGAKIMTAKNRATIQEFGAFIDWEKGDFIKNQAGFKEGREGVINGFKFVDYVPACCFLVPTGVIKKVGVFREDFFLYWDDIEWSQRVRMGGYQIHAVGDAVCWHHGGGGMKNSLIPTYYFWRNRIVFFKENCAPPKWRGLRKTLLHEAALAAFTCEIFFRPRTAKIIRRAVADGLVGMLGVAQFEVGETALEKVPGQNLDCSPEFVKVVNQVIGDAREAWSETANLMLQDRFGHVLSAKRAWELKLQFENSESETELNGAENPLDVFLTRPALCV